MLYEIPLESLVTKKLCAGFLLYKFTVYIFYIQIANLLKVGIYVN